MADTARSAVVSNEALGGLCVEEVLRNGAKDGSDVLLTECSVTNHTNHCSNRTGSDEKESGYQEIDSFSELSFKTNDEISLQDLMETEFAARMSTMNGDDESEMKEILSAKSQDPFNDLFDDLDPREIQNGVAGKSPDRNGEGEMVTNLDDFINGPMQGNTGLITDFLDEYHPEETGTRGKSVNIFKSDAPTEIPILTNFDPFAAIEEDSDCSNPIPANPNVLSSPDEFPFPDSPERTDGADDPKTGIPTEEIESPDAITKFFSRRISDDNMEYFSEENRDESDGEPEVQASKSEESIDSTNFPSEKIELDEFYSSEDIPNRKENSNMAAASSPLPPPPPANDQEPFEEVVDRLRENFSPGNTFQETDDCWTTVEEVLNAQTNNIKSNGDDTCLVNVTNECDKTNNYFESCTNDVSDKMGPNKPEANGQLESDSETETRSESSEKKTIKKKKSKKGKKSEEKENISVEQEEAKPAGKLSENSSNAALEDSDDLSNVCVKDLMLTYSSEGPRSLQNRWYKQTTEPGSIQNLKSSFSKFDQLSKKTVLHVRSVDASKVQKQFNEATTGASEVSSTCKSCGKQVFQMEQVKAEKSVWHKNCFRCKECNKQLSVDTYSSNEGILYCKPHFKDLFKPKAVLEDDAEPVKLKKPELIIRENQPVELPPEVVRASDKPDLGLEELASLNVKSRYQVFEKGEEVSHEPLERSPSGINVKRSPSILSKLAKFQKKGIDVGVRDEELNGLPMEQSSTSSEEEEDEADESSTKIVKSKKTKERPMSFSKLGDMKSVWESGMVKTREEMREERKAEIHQIRSKLFMGKQVKMKEAYEQAVRESENVSPKKSIDVRCEKAKSIKECFEKGEPLNVDDENGDDSKKKIAEDEMSLFEAGISKKSRSLFLELDKSAKTQSAPFVKKAPSSKSPTAASPRTREVLGPRSALTQGNKALMKILVFPHEKTPKNQKDNFCAYKGIGLWSERNRRASKKIGFYCEIRPGPDAHPSVPQNVAAENVVKCSDAVEDVQIETADISSKFKFFETYKEPEREKKKFRITPPREGQMKSESPEREITRDPNVVRACDKPENEIIRTNTTTKMLSLFRQMEEKTEEIPEGPKPLKCFTPPPDYKEESDEESEETGESDEEEDEADEVNNPNLIRASDRIEDEYLKQAANAARAKQLRAKFEKWEEKEKEKEKGKEKESGQRKVNGFGANETSTENSENIEVTSIECTKSLRARFESMKGGGENPKDKIVRPKVNRFVEIQNNMAELCNVCRGRVYQLEKIETSGKIFHKACFRCMQCKCLLRMESFTLNCGNLYCLPHFKQKFISKGNYDEGFGVDQHKAKWPTVTSF